MGLYLQVDLEDAVPLASNRGWSDVLDYAKALPKGEFMELRRLCQFGWSGEVGSLRRDVLEALEDQPPAKDVETTLRGLAESLQGKGGATVVTVTDGMGQGESGSPRSRRGVRVPANEEPIDEGDVEAGLQTWDEAMPAEFRGILNARVVE